MIMPDEIARDINTNKSERILGFNAWPFLQSINIGKGFACFLSDTHSTCLWMLSLISSNGLLNERQEWSVPSSDKPVDVIVAKSRSLIWIRENVGVSAEPWGTLALFLRILSLRSVDQSRLVFTSRKVVGSSMVEFRREPVRWKFVQKSAFYTL